jgi:hypothetical protein
MRSWRVGSGPAQPILGSAPSTGETDGKDAPRRLGAAARAASSVSPEPLSASACISATWFMGRSMTARPMSSSSRRGENIAWRSTGFCGSRGRATAPGDPVGGWQQPSLPRPINSQPAGATSLCSIFGVLNIFLETLLLGSFQRHQLDRQLVNCPGETERWLVVIIVNPSAGIHADVEGLVDRLHKRNGARDRFAGDYLAVHRQDATTTFPEPGTIVFEVKFDRVFAGRERRRSFKAGSFHIKEVLDKDWLALEQIEAVPTASAPKRIDHALGTLLTREPEGTALRYLHLRCNGEGLAGDVGRVTVGQA